MSELKPTEPPRHTTEEIFPATFPAPEFELDVNKGRSKAEGLFVTVIRRIINGVEQPATVRIALNRTKKDGTTNYRAVNSVALVGRRDWDLRAEFTSDWDLRAEFTSDTQTKLREYADKVLVEFDKLWK